MIVRHHVSRPVGSNGKRWTGMLIDVNDLANTMYSSFGVYGSCNGPTGKTCLKRPLKIDKTKVLKINGSLMKVEIIAECSLGAFCNTLALI